MELVGVKFLHVRAPWAAFLRRFAAGPRTAFGKSILRGSCRGRKPWESSQNGSKLRRSEKNVSHTAGNLILHLIFKPRIASL